ncbi:MBL fold metallo-hydrolase [uncultured Clostridium sp.]|uniref:MBL fold metallo-hydrolase n=1 Tax=uncultured Clostridium sp. TaxID=59620 RepID=UPI00261AF24C|nr:MBL fold metallo-hydrolase [uncultured Clostridium sp.]
MEKLTILGTGSAMVTKCYNTCFTISDNTEHFLVDAGGGNTILVNLEKANINIDKIKHMFISHTHGDHILGAPWVIRAVATKIAKKSYDGIFTVYGEKSVLDAIKTICNFVLKKKFLDMFGKEIIFKEVSGGQTLNILGRDTTFFDIKSTKLLQYGFKTTLLNGKSLVFIGDEPYREEEKDYALNTDYLLHEAFCLYSEKDKYKPYEKHHATAKDACANATLVNAKNVIIYHTEDDNLDKRKDLYTNEGKTEFTGNIIVPDDLEIIEL